MHATPRRFPRSRRGWILFALVLSGALAWSALGLSPGDLVPRKSASETLGAFLGAALSPATDYEAAFVPEGTPALWWQALDATWSTLLFAAAGMSLALGVGLVLGFLGASSWWAQDEACNECFLLCVLKRSAGPLLYAVVRVLIAGMRSVHELVWAVIFLAAFGLSDFTAVLALAIPFAGSTAKVFSEMLDECPRDSAYALRAAGAGPSQVFVFGLFPRALPDMAAYAFYHFECAVRSSAVMGFFGFPTLGYHIKLSFENVHYREVWTYLYALLAVIVLLELWSAALRRRVVAR